MTNAQNNMTVRLDCLTWEEIVISDEEQGTLYRNYWSKWSGVYPEIYPEVCVTKQEWVQKKFHKKGWSFEKIKETLGKDLENGWTLTLVPESPAALPG